MERNHGKEATKTTASSTLLGTDSAAVHTGLGHPGSGQSSAELRKDGRQTRTTGGDAVEGRGAVGGSGLTGEEGREANRLLEDRSQSQSGATAEHNASLDGVEQIESVRSEELAAERE